MNCTRTLWTALLGALALLMPLQAMSQDTLTMANGATMSITTCPDTMGVIVDNGGADNNYIDYFDGTVELHWPAGLTLHIVGTYETESGYDYMNVVDGLVDLMTITGLGTVDFTSTSGVLKLTFHSDGSVTRPGFVLNWTLEGLGASCADPITGLTVGAITANSVLLNLEGTAASHVVEVGDESHTFSGNSYTLTGLSPAQYYSALVYPEGSTSLCCAQQVSFRTDCGTATLPYVESFEDVLEGEMPPCWLRITNFDDALTRPQVSSGGSDGAKSLMVSCGSTPQGGHFGLVATPPLAGSGDRTTRLSVMTTHNGAQLVIGTLAADADEYDTSSFVRLQTLTLYNEGQWVDYQIDWTSPADGSRLVFFMKQSMQGGTGRRVYIDLPQTATCGVGELTVSQVLDTSVRLTWTSFGSPTCRVTARLVGSLVDVLTIDGATSPLIITGLSPEISYEFTVHPDCGDLNGITCSRQARTEPTPASAIGYCADFANSPTLPYGWQMIGFSPQSGGCGNIYYTQGRIDINKGCSYEVLDSCMVVSPRLQNLAGQTVSIPMEVYPYGGMAVFGTLSDPEDLTSFTPLDSLPMNMAEMTWTRVLHSFTIPSTSDGVCVGMVFKNHNGWAVSAYVYGMVIGEVETVWPYVAHHRGTSVELRWDRVRDRVIIEYGLSGFTLGTGQRDTVRNSDRYTIDSLQTNTDYQFYAWVPELDPCPDMRVGTYTAMEDHPLPACENFNELDYPWGRWNGDWDVINWLNGFPTIGEHPYFYHAGHAVVMSSYGFDNMYYTTLTLPDTPLDTGTVVSFYASSFAPQSRLVFGTYNSEHNPYFHAFDTLTIASGRTHYAYVLPDSVIDAEGRLALQWFHEHPYSYYQCYIDELNIDTAAYGHLSYLHVSYDTASFGLDTLIHADSVLLTLYGGGDTISTVWSPTDSLCGIAGLDSSTLYLVYLSTYGDSGLSCPSYTGYIITPGGGGGYSNCHYFDNYLSYEVPGGWYFLDSARTDGGLLVFDSIAVMPPVLFGNGTTLNLRKADLDTLYIGYTTDSTDFICTDTVTDIAASFYLHDFPDTGAYIALRASDTCHLDMIGLTGCPIVDFTSEGGRLTCTIRGNHSADYLLTVQALGSSDSRSYHATQTPFVVTDLAPGTTYQLSYQCPGDISECTPIVYITIDDSITLPYCEHFDMEGGVGVPGNWTFFYDDDVPQMLELGWGETPLRFGEWGRQRQMAVLPAIHHDGAMTARLRSYTWNYGILEMGLVDGNLDTSTFVPMAINTRTEWSEMYIDIDSLGDRRIALRTNDLALIDWVSVLAQPAIQVSLVADHTIHINASRNDTLYVRYNDYWPSYNDSIIVVDTLPYILQVNPSVTQIRLTQITDSLGTNCGSEGDLYNLSKSKSVPYCSMTNFNSGDFLRYGGRTWREPWVSSNYGKRAWAMNSDYNVGDGYDYLVLPYIIGDSLYHYNVGFSMRSYWDFDTMEVGVLTDAYDTGAFVPIGYAVYVDSINHEWQSYNVSLSSYSGDGHWIVFRHRGRSDIYSNGYIYLTEFTVSECPKMMATASASASLYRWNIVRVEANDTGFMVEYGPLGFTPGTGTIEYIDSLPYDLTLEAKTMYDIYFRCDSNELSCRPGVTVGTLNAPVDLPMCIDFDTAVVGTPPESWTTIGSTSRVSPVESHSGGQSMATRLSGYGSAFIVSPELAVDSIRQYAVSLWLKAPAEGVTFEVGTLSSPTDASGFFPAATFGLGGGEWIHLSVDLSQAPATAHYIALHAIHNGWYSDSLYIDDLNIAACAAFNLRAHDVNPDNITLDWSQTGSPTITVTVVEDSVPVSVIHPYAPPLTIYGLSPHSQYTFLFSSTCPDSTAICTTDYIDSVTLVMPAAAGDCINPTDLYSPNAVFFSGDYGNPYSVAGPIDYGADNAASRHTVCTDTSARDPRTGGLLRTIPEGFTSSVRLGNWSSSGYYPGEAEGVIYSLLIDTGSFQLLLLHYAAVLQDPMHAPEDQPRFRLELLDSAFNLIDPECTSADFIADQSLGWNTAGGGVLWKDWTAVGIDLSSHAGEQVYVRLTTYDCNEGSHYGYAYFTLECMRKALGTQVCGAQDSNTLTAPAGFNYRWYTSASSTTLSTSQSITIPTADITYFCDLTKIDNPNCLFTISAYGGTRYPMASFDTMMTIENCHFHVTFINTSAVSKDNINPIAGEQCESAQWFFGNGQSSTSYHSSMVYLLPGTYTVMLVSGIAGDQCMDTAYMTLNLELPEGMQPTDVENADICEGGSYPFRENVYTQTGTYYSTSPNPGQCDSLHVLNLTAWPATTSDTVAVACDSLAWRDSTYLLSGRYPVATGVPNAHGCDSTRTLDLTLHYSDTTVLNDTLVQNELPYSVAGTSLSMADLNLTNRALGTFANQYHLATAFGCDSLVDLHLSVWRNRDTIIDTTVCRNLLPIVYHDSVLNPPGNNAGYSFSLLTAAGADSLVALLVHVVNNPLATFADTVIENDLPVVFRGLTFDGPADTTITLAGVGCDTLAHYTLHVWPNRDTVLRRIVCRDQLPYTFDSALFSDPGTDSIPLTQSYSDSATVLLADRYGADSTVTYLLTVGGIYDTIDTLVICPGHPYLYRGVDYGGPASFDTVLMSVYGCDSLVHVALVPRDTNYRSFTYYRFDDTPWEMPDSLLASCHSTTLHLWDTTPGTFSRFWFVATADTLLTSTDSLFSYTFPLTDSQAVAALIIENRLGCIDTLAWPVAIFQHPYADFRWDPEVPVMSHPETQFYNLSTLDSSRWSADSTYPLTYLWHIGSPNGGDDTSTLVNPYYSWGEGNEGITGDAEVTLTAYWLHVRDSLVIGPFPTDSIASAAFVVHAVEHTCPDSTTRTVIITNDYLQFPNLVTPNGDGHNDVWRIVNLVEYGEYPTNELWIYNQWGALVYHARDIRSADEYWDPNATNSPDGPYYYRFTARGRFGITKRNGLIEVLR